MTSEHKSLTCADYHVAWISPVPDVELLPARLMLDEEHPTPPYDTHFDENTYICGTINGHAVVVATCPQGETGNVNAGRLTGPLFKTFPNIRIALLVGIGGGIPRADVSEDTLENLHLGDVVVGWPGDGKPACVYYDRGKAKVGGDFETVGTVQNPDWRVISALSILESDHELGRTKFEDQLARFQKFKKKKFTHPGVEHDRLYKASYRHVGEYRSACTACDENELIKRPQRTEDDQDTIVFHLGRIATGNAVIRDGEQRDKISARCNGALCVEMEAAGVDVNRRCLVIRGISDYADSHKNDVWRSYAAGAAAAFTRTLLCRIPPGTVKAMEVEVNYLPNTIEETSASQNQMEDSLSVSDTLPSLTTGQTAQSVTMDPKGNEATTFDLGDKDSQVSDLKGVTPEDRDRIASGFTMAISRRIQSLLINFSSFPISQKRLQDVFASKLKNYAKDVVSDTPSTIEYKRKRNAAKTIFWCRNDIAARAIQVLFPSQDDQEPRPLDKDPEMSYLERIDLMSREAGDYPSESWAQEFNEDPGLYLKMDYDDGKVDMLDITEISTYLTSRNEFTVLDLEFERLARHYCGDTMGLIQKTVLQTLSKASTDGLPTIFRARCNILSFIREQYGTGLRDLGHMLAITGNCCDAQLATVGLYIKQIWPSYPDVLLHALQSAVFGKEQSSIEQPNIATTSKDSCTISIQDDMVIAKVSGSHEFKYTIGQQLAWFGAVCRGSEGGLVYCDTICETKQDQTKRDGADCHFAFSYDLYPFDEDEIKPCWHRLIGSMVVATGLPIPSRPNEEPGLQIPIDIMATLGHVLAADDFGSGIVLKGDAFDFFPVIRNGDYVQWHLVDSAKNALEMYENITEHSRLSSDEFSIEELGITTAFLGWTRYITNNSGTESIEYAKIQWARASQTPELSVSMSGFSFSLTKIFGATTTFAIGQKQYSQEAQDLDNYGEIIRDLQDRIVILYDTQTHRGWLLDGARATLQILFHRYKSRKEAKDVNFMVKSEDSDIHSVMIKNRETKLWEDWDSTKNEKKDVLFAAEVKKIREKLVELATTAQAEYRRLNSCNKVVGFEYRGVVETPENLDPLTMKLDSTCGEWPRIAHRQLYATVLFGFNFQEIMVPKYTTRLCSRYRRMPSKRSYLAAESKFIYSLMSKMQLSLVSTDSVFPICTHPDDDTAHCSCIRVQAIKAGKMKDAKILLDISSSAGAIIIGERIPRQLSRSKPPDRNQAITSVVANTTSKLAQLAIVSGDGSSSHSRTDFANDSPGRQLGGQPSGIEPPHPRAQGVEGRSSAFLAARSHWETTHVNQPQDFGNE